MEMGRFSIQNNKIGIKFCFWHQPEGDQSQAGAQVFAGHAALRCDGKNLRQVLESLGLELLPQLHSSWLPSDYPLCIVLATRDPTGSGKVSAAGRVVLQPGEPLQHIMCLINHAD